MKKTKFLLIIVAVIFLTGCSNSLKCKVETKNYDSTIKITFKDDKPIKYKYKDEMRFSAKTADNEIYYHSKYSEYSTLISEKYAHVRNNQSNVSMKVNYDFEKDSSSDEKKLLISRNDTKKTATEKIESSGYTCK